MVHLVGRTVAAQLAVQLCSAGRPALYKLKSSGDSSELTRIALGQSGVKQVGEDAMFIRNGSSPDTDDVIAFGVADGVGGWREQGVDPAKASLALLTACADTAVAKAASTTLKEALASAHRGLLTSKRDLIGSTTVCLARLTPNTRLLEVANLGDSGLCVVNSEFQLKLRTRFQSNMGGVFNCPMQLAFPAALSNQYPKPEDCDLYSVTLEPGDIAMVATDGLWDNLYQRTIEDIFRHAFKKSRSNKPPTSAEPHHQKTSASKAADQSPADDEEAPLETAAKILVDAATHLSTEQAYFSPFCQNAKAAGLKYTGGKEDDITVVLARLCPAEEAGDQDDSGPAAKL